MKKIRRPQETPLRSPKRVVEKTVYVFSKLMPWKSLGMTGLPGTKIRPINLQGSASQGFLIVYDSLESLQYDHGKDAQHFTLTIEQQG